MQNANLSVISHLIRVSGSLRNHNKESVMAVVFYIEKAYDVEEGLMIKLNMIGIAGRTYNWIKDFLFDRSIQVRIKIALSGNYMVDSGTPQGSVISPVVFSVINCIFSQVQGNIGWSLFADDRVNLQGHSED